MPYTGQPSVHVQLCQISSRSIVAPLYISYYHIIILSYYHIIILSYYHIIILSYYHIIILSYYHIIKFKGGRECKRICTYAKWYFGCLPENNELHFGELLNRKRIRNSRSLTTLHGRNQVHPIH